MILSLPVFGFLLFVLFGINPLLRFKRNDYLNYQAAFIKHENFEFTKRFLKKSDLDENTRHIFSFSVNSEQRPIYENNAIEVIKNPKDLYEKSLALIEQAKDFIHLQYYIISDGVWLRSIANALIRKVREGVKIRLIYDWLGAYNRGANKIINALKKAGVFVGAFNPATVTKYTSKTNFRCHRKCLIVDNKLALYGGSNIADEYIRYAK